MSSIPKKNFEKISETSPAIRPELAIPWPVLPREEWHRKVLGLLRQAKPEELDGVSRALAEKDFYFFIYYILGWTWIDCDWSYALAKYCERRTWGRLFVCAREHYKSTVITIAHTVWYLLLHPGKVGVIYSYNAASAQRLFYQPVKAIFETCGNLQALWPEVVWDDPQKNAGFWTTDAGFDLKGHAPGRKEHTLEYASILKLKTGSHFDFAVYDDCVTLETVVTPESIAACITAWQQSLNTLARGSVWCMVGTFYHYAELYNHVIEHGILKPVIQPCVDRNGVPVRFTREELAQKKLEMGQGVFATQMMCDPKAASQMGFKEEWLQYWEPKVTGGLNLYIIVDPASVVSRRTDYTTMWVLGLDAAGNYMVVDVYRDKLSLSQRTDLIFQLHRKYKPLAVYWESVGNTDIEHLKAEMDVRSYHFPISPYTQWVKKENRIEALEPDFMAHRIWLPKFGTCVHENWEGRPEDMVRTFVEVEYLSYPVMAHDDAIDALGNIHHPQVHLERPDKDTESEKWEAALKDKGFAMPDKQEDYYPW